MCFVKLAVTFCRYEVIDESELGILCSGMFLRENDIQLTQNQQILETAVSGSFLYCLQTFRNGFSNPRLSKYYFLDVASNDNLGKLAVNL